MNSTSTALRHDIVVFGATSFVGQILCRYLLQRHGVGQGLRWAIAARSSSTTCCGAARSSIPTTHHATPSPCVPSTITSRTYSTSTA